MADWESGLDDPEAARGVPSLTSLLAPDENSATMGSMGGVGPGAMGPQAVADTTAAKAPPAASPAAAPTAAPTAPVPPSMADLSGSALQSERGAAQSQLSDADKMTVPAEIAQRRSQMEQDAAQSPNASDPQYKVGFGTRVLRGLEGMAKGFADGKGAINGLFDPAAVGAKAYGAPNDAYDTALDAQKKKVAGDTQSYQDSLDDLKRTSDMVKQRQDALKAGGEGMGKVATEANAAQKIPIDQQNADANTTRAQNESPEAKGLAETAKIQARQNDPTAQAMKPGYAKTRYILTGDIQPLHDTTAEEQNVAQLTSAWKRENPGKLPGTADLAKIYQQVKGAATGGTSGLPDNPNGLTGDSYIKTLPDGMQNTVRAIGEGREKPPSATDRSPQAQATLAAVNVAYPGFDATAYPTYAATRKAFTSGSTGTGINAFHTALNHLDRLEQNIPDNTGVALLNAADSALSTSGSARSQQMAKFDDDATAVSGEVAKAYKGGAITEGERDHMLNLLNRNDAPETMKAHIAEFRELLQGKLDSYQRQWESGMPPGAVSPIQTLGRAAAGGQGAAGGSGESLTPNSTRAN